MLSASSSSETEAIDCENELGGQGEGKWTLRHSRAGALTVSAFSAMDMSLYFILITRTHLRCGGGDRTLCASNRNTGLLKERAHPVLFIQSGVRLMEGTRLDYSVLE